MTILALGVLLFVAPSVTLAEDLAADLAQLPEAPSGQSLDEQPAPSPVSSLKSESAPGCIEFTPKNLEERHRWSAAFGVGIIGDTTVADYADLAFDRLDGDGGGLTYNFTVTYHWREFDWRLGRLRLRPQVEVPFMLTLVDDGKLDFAPDFNLGLVFRWRDWPWNRYLYTTFAAGVGLSYATEVWTGDYQRHEGDEDRSQWKFWLPIEATLALPCYPQHQLMLFIDHQSGGHIFDAGGIDAWGFGYRHLF